MKPEFQPIRFTLVDFMASFLPGVVWLILLMTLINLPIFNKQSAITTPTDIVLNILNTTILTNAYISVVFTSIVTIIVFIIGYIMNQVGTEIPEAICFADSIWKSKINRVNQSEYHFPYNFRFRTKPYFARIISSLHIYIQEDFKELPGKQPFSSCKRILRVINSGLWEESEHAEADSRMIGSLFTASIFSMVCACLALLTTSSLAIPQILWLSVSIMAFLLLGFLFRTNRTREVAYTYLNYLIALGLENKSNETSNKNRVVSL